MIIYCAIMSRNKKRIESTSIRQERNRKSRITETKLKYVHEKILSFRFFSFFRFFLILRDKEITAIFE